MCIVYPALGWKTFALNYIALVTKYQMDRKIIARSIVHACIAVYNFLLCYI